MMQVLELYQSMLEVQPFLLQVFNNNLQRMFLRCSSSTKTLYLIGNKQKTDRTCIYSIGMSESVSHQNVLL